MDTLGLTRGDVIRFDMEDLAKNYNALSSFRMKYSTVQYLSYLTVPALISGTSGSEGSGSYVPSID